MIFRQTIWIKASYNKISKMKRTDIFLLVIIILGCSDPISKNNFSLNLNITGELEQKIYLSKRDAGKWVNIDSSSVVTGEIVLNGQIKDPEMFYLRSGQNLTNIFIEAGKITFTAHADSINKGITNGSKSQAELDSFNESISLITEQLDTLYNQYREAAKNDDQVRLEELSELIDTKDDERLARTIDYAYANNKSIVSAYLIMTNNYYLELAELDTITSNFDNSIKQTKYVELLLDRIRNLYKVSIGSSFTDFTLNDTTGNPIALSSLIGENYLLIDFWASWCGPCRRENPNIVAVYNDYNSKGFDIIGVSLDTDKNNWIKAIEKDSLTWSHVSDLQGWNSAAGKLYAVNAIPHSVILNENGTIVAKNLRGEELRDKIAELLN
ncbi:MAG: thioredoxin-like domain-containing protein [Candidatus Neomarinimicrobiota bacterium]|nr:thioredoxin-like domain-containing protein [Candidatus Neomarinimicrobiota bacterium]